MTPRKSLVLGTFVLFFASACGSDQTGPTAVDNGGLILAAAGPSASGHVEIDDLGSAFSIEKYSFNARIVKGAAQGQFQIKDVITAGGKITVHGEVTCLVVEPDGKTARMTGVVTSSSIETMVGTNTIWTVRDNGEGKKAPRDEATDLRYGVTQASADAHCATGIDPAAFGTFQESDRGNVQVRP